MAPDKQQLLNELKNNPRVTAYLAGFDESSADRFLDSYASTKELLLRHGEDWRKREGGTYFRTCAENYYWLIAQKKLFNLQCLWRAEKISLPLTVTWEFQYWSKNIKSCPFVEDITEIEIEAMINYLEKSTYDHEESDPWDWQNYDEFKDEETGVGAGDNYPDWYGAYDAYFGTHNLMALPNLKGKLEEKYLAAWWSINIPTTSYSPPAKPYIFSSEETTEQFIRKTEDYKILDYYRLYRAQTNRIDFMDQVRRELELFMEQDGDVYIPEGKFPDAIFQAGHLLKVSHVKSLLFDIHQNHLERKAMGITYEQKGTPQDDHLVKDTITRIREGKRILGESED